MNVPQITIIHIKQLNIGYILRAIPNIDPFPRILRITGLLATAILTPLKHRLYFISLSLLVLLLLQGKFVLLLLLVITVAFSFLVHAGQILLHDLDISILLLEGNDFRLFDLGRGGVLAAAKFVDKEDCESPEVDEGEVDASENY